MATRWPTRGSIKLFTDSSVLLMIRSLQALAVELMEMTQVRSISSLSRHHRRHRRHTMWLLHPRAEYIKLLTGADEFMIRTPFVLTHLVVRVEASAVAYNINRSARRISLGCTVGLITTSVRCSGIGHV